MNALFRQNKLVKLKNYILTNYIEEKELWLHRINLQIGNLPDAAIYFSEHYSEDKSIPYLAMLHLARLNHSNTKKLITRLSKENPSSIQKSLIKIAKKILADDKIIALSMINTLLEKKFSQEDRLYKLELFASYLSMDIFKLDHAHQYLVKYEKHTRNDPSCRVAIARLAQKRHDMKKLVDQLSKAFGDYIELLPEDLYISYLSELDNKEKSAYLLDKWLKDLPNNMELNELKISILFSQNKWSEIIQTVKYNENFNENIAYMYISSLLKVGKINEANKLSKSRTNKENYFYWKLAAETAEKNKDFDTLKICLENQLKLTDSL